MFCHHVHRVFHLHHQTFVMNFSYSVVRHLLRTGHCSNGSSLLRDAHAGEPGVLMLVHLLAQVRCNRRTRKTVPQIVVASKQNRKPRWLSVFTKQLYMLWSVLHKAARPTSKVSRKDTLTGQPLTQGVRRVLANCGVVTNRPVPLTAKATSAAQQLWSSMSNHQMAMWFANWWWKRSTTDQEHPNPSMNLTVFAMLHTTDLCPFPGHPSLVTVLGQLDSAVHSTATALRSLNDVTRASLDAEPEFIRVPLDIKRDNVRSLQFRPLLLTDLTTGGILDLLHILQEIQDIHVHESPFMADKRDPLVLSNYIFELLEVNPEVAGFLIQLHTEDVDAVLESVTAHAEKGAGTKTTLYVGQEEEEEVEEEVEEVEEVGAGRGKEKPHNPLMISVQKVRIRPGKGKGKSDGWFPQPLTHNTRRPGLH